MKAKYITTDKHPELKQGIYLIPYIDDMSNFDMIEPNLQYWRTEEFNEITPDDIKFWLKKGYVKEVQEPKWTDEDMIDIIKYVSNIHDPKGALEQFEMNKRNEI